ncbi:MAG: ComEC/Rec2 family competence protein [Acidocella sp.]|nr:ComEC/Rec2 family competence protein [Acidocella sp.]
MRATIHAWVAEWVEAEQGRFILLAPVAMGAAILIYFALPTEPPLWLGDAGLGGAVCLLALSWRHQGARYMAMLLFMAALGFWRAAAHTAAMPGFMIAPSGPTEIAGVITQIEASGQARRITLGDPQIDGGPPNARTVILRVKANDQSVFTPGESVAGYALLFAPERPAYPGAWDPGRQDFFAGVGANGVALGVLRVTAPVRAAGLAMWLARLRGRIAAQVMAVLPVSTGAVAVTLLTGDEQAIPVAERQNFIAAGLAHILAVAGLHVGIVMGLVFAAVRLALCLPERLALRLDVKAMAAMAALLAGAGYAALTGAHLPILRSLAMASLATFGVVMGRRAISLRALALAALAIMLMTPEAVLGVSFQMSFSAVLALIAGFEALRRRRARGQTTRSAGGWVMRHIGALALTSFLAGGASMPFAAFQFQQIQPYWIPANLVAVPLMAVWVMPLGLLALGLMPLGLAKLALVPMGWGIGAIIWITVRIAALPAAMLRVSPMPNAAILLIAAGLVTLCIWRTRLRWAGLGLMVAGVALCLAVRPPSVLISADARMVGLRNGNAVLVVSARAASAYIMAQWAPVWAGLPFVQARCTAAACNVEGVLLAVSPPVDCGSARLVVSLEPLHGACSGLDVIDKASIWRDGAIAAWVSGNQITLRTDRAAQGVRPWVFPYPH